ncbi:MAG: nitrophenyl compound nitroreductase subunit ArsF family protein [Candidatus Moranbacteria bacterium]|nr:nitrophenyl compound nitroreductase subunit ArsF family protein [Candidatus Moranbacteria bacterium]
MINNEKNSDRVKKLGTYLLYGGALIFAIALIWISTSSDKETKSNSANTSTQVSTPKTAGVQPVKPAEKIQVYEFHSTNRCYSCITMGQYIKATLEESFQAELKSGKIDFREINVDLPENKEVATKFKATGTSLFINSIIDGQDNIKEDTQIWRLVTNEKSFSDYLSAKLKDIIGEKASAQADDKDVEKKDIVFYFSDDCPECTNIEKYLMENDVKNKIGFEEKNIDKNEVDAQQMAEDAMYCNVDEESFGAPFLWAEGKCYTGEQDIINFFDDSLKGLK